MDQEQHASLDTAKSMDNEAGAAFMLTGSARDYDRVLCAVAEPILYRLAEQSEAQAVLSVWRGQ